MKFIYKKAIPIMICFFFCISCTEKNVLNPPTDLYKQQAKIDTIRPNDDVTVRQNQQLNSLFNNPGYRSGAYYYCQTPTTEYMLGKNIDDANRLMIEFCDVFYPSVGPEWSGSFHWEAYMVERLYFLFSSKSKFYPGRMSKEAQERLEDVFWDYVNSNCPENLVAPLEEKYKIMWGTGNMHAMSMGTYWGALQILRNVDRYKDKAFADGTTPITLSKEFEDYIIAYFKLRMSHGISAETASTYQKYAISNFFNMADFSDNAKLKESADHFLNVYWAEWAIEQLNGVRGGARTRTYPGGPSISESCNDMIAWYLFGLGPQVLKNHYGITCVYTTFWRPSKIVTNLVKDHFKKGNYSYVSRCLGLQDPNSPGQYDYDNSGFLRYSWVTPSFVMGLFMVDVIPSGSWVGISSQNRWNGIIFDDNDGNYCKRIFTQTTKQKDDYNSEWGVQDKGVMILQRLTYKDGVRIEHGCKGQAIWVEISMPLEEENGWYFSETKNTYIAIKVVNGNTTIVDAMDYGTGGIAGRGRWIKLDNEKSPIIYEVVNKSDFPSTTDFRKYIFSNDLVVDNASVTYSSSYYKNKLKLYYDYSSLPLVNDVPINLSPNKLLDSPYLNSDFGTGIVTISDGENSETYDFN